MAAEEDNGQDLQRHPEQEDPKGDIASIGSGNLVDDQPQPAKEEGEIHEQHEPAVERGALGFPTYWLSSVIPRFGCDIKMISY